MPCFQITYYPGRSPLVYGRSCKEWTDVIERLEYWVSVVKKELSEPSPWVLLNQGTMLKDSIPRVAGMIERFDEAELSKLHEHLESTRQFLISKTKPSKEHLKLIDERLSYLEDSARR